MWKAFAEQFKECGRNGTLFVLAFLVVLSCGLLAPSLGPGGVAALWMVWVALAFRSAIRFVQNWRHPARLGRLPPLAQNDLKVARSKLMKCHTQRLNPSRSLSSRHEPLRQSRV